MPLPQQDPKYHIIALETALAQANNNIAARDGFITQLALTIDQQDTTINDLLSQVSHEESQIVNQKPDLKSVSDKIPS